MILLQSFVPLINCRQLFSHFDIVSPKLPIVFPLTGCCQSFSRLQAVANCLSAYKLLPIVSPLTGCCQLSPRLRLLPIVSQGYGLCCFKIVSSLENLFQFLSSHYNETTFFFLITLKGNTGLYSILTSTSPVLFVTYLHCISIRCYLILSCQ